jgi:hypothetical protein
MKYITEVWKNVFKSWIWNTRAVYKKIPINKFFPKIVLLIGNVEKYGTARQVAGDNIIQRMRIACWITKATDTHSEYVIRMAIPWQEFL